MSCGSGDQLDILINKELPQFNIQFYKQGEGIPELYGLEDGGDAFLLNSNDYTEEVSLVDASIDHYPPFILRDKSVIIASTQDDPPRINKFNYYTKEGVFDRTVTFDNDGFPNIPSYDEDMNVAFYSYGGGTYWDNGLVELSTGRVLAAKNLNELYGQGKIVPNVGIVAIKVVGFTTYIAMLDFDLNEVWSQTVEPHPQIAGSTGAKAIRISSDRQYVFVAVSLSNNDISILKLNIADGTYVAHSPTLSTKMVTGADEQMVMAESDKIYILSSLNQSNGEAHTLEIVNPDMTVDKLLTFNSPGFAGYTDSGSGTLYLQAGQSIEDEKPDKLFFVGYESTGSFPSPGFYAELDVATEQLEIFEDAVFDYDFRDEVTVPGGYPYQKTEVPVDLVPYPEVTLDANTDTTVDISWTFQSGEDIQGFDVYLDGVKQNVSQLGIGTTSYQFTGLTEQTTYLIHVKAIDSLANESLFSNLILVTTNETPPSPTAETFDSLALGTTPTGYTQAAGSDASWVVTNQRSKSGAQSLGSVDITHNQTAAVEVTVNYGSQDDIVFNYLPSCENNYDFFRFYIDGVLEFEESGEFNQTADTLTFKKFTKTLAAGTYTFKFEFAKDGSADEYDDRCYVDNVDFFSGTIQ